MRQSGLKLLRCQRIPGNLAIIKRNIEMVWFSIREKRRHGIAGKVGQSRVAQVVNMSGLRSVRPKIAKARKHGDSHARRQTDQYPGCEE